MAEALGVVASVIAVIQISKEVISACKFYIEALRSDAPTSLRTILIEVSTLKSVLENLEFISKCETFTATLQNRLAASDGPIEGCSVAMTALEKLFPKRSLQSGQNTSKRQKVQATFATLAWPLKQGQVQELLQQISRHREGIQLALTTEVTKDIKDIKAASEEIRSILTEEQGYRVCNWLTSTDPSPIHNRSRKLYEDGTGSWILRSQHWTDWLATRTRCLWVHGIPGSGKTILASWMITNIQAHCDRVSTSDSPYVSAYYYCYFGHHQDETAPFLRWVITQLSRAGLVVSTLMHDLFKHGTEPSIPELLGALEQLLQMFSRVYIVIDAVDESDPRDELLEVLQTLVTDQRFCNVQILVTSREYIDIERVMEDVSVSVPMANELVEQDIRLHIRSIVRSNLKLRCWPHDVLIEVEDAVSKKANGMFRWAVCQLHELQRLKGKREIVRLALQQLPKDLDETYDRIFRRLPPEDWQFVSHAFQWLWFYAELHPSYLHGTPSSLLFDAIESSTSRSNNHNSHVLYNAERLRELCGCLFSSLKDPISFAHYTVKEYLESHRIRQGPLLVFSTERTKVLSTCLGTLLHQAQTFASHYLKDLEAGHRLLFDEEDLWGNLNFHAVFHTLDFLREWGKEISESDELYGRVKALLHPSTQYFGCLGKLGFNEGRGYWLELLDDAGLSDEKYAWTIEWNENFTDSVASLFLSLLLITGDIFSPLISRVIQEADIQALFSNRIVLKRETALYSRSNGGQENSFQNIYEFDGPLIDVVVHFVDPTSSRLDRLLLNHIGLYNPSTALIHFIGYYQPEPFAEFPFFCLLEHLSEAGAQPNLQGYPITPLQIAVAARNFKGIRLLLEFKADPNYIGDPLGSAWPKNNLMAEFDRFRGMSPLRICRSGKYLSLVDNLVSDTLETSTEEIEELLVAYGGKDFQWEPDEPWTGKLGEVSEGGLLSA